MHRKQVDKSKEDNVHCLGKNPMEKYCYLLPFPLQISLKENSYFHLFQQRKLFLPFLQPVLGQPEGRTFAPVNSRGQCNASSRETARL